ncbi:copia protein [Tanacetum coccineum]|uniref:Copia protein n=1 Tax=Tanacetum coccineum TaxID=301880 RepID=A0ABQ5HDB2_9ASTR
MLDSKEHGISCDEVEDLDDQQFIVHTAQPMHTEERTADKEIPLSSAEQALHDELDTNGVFRNKRDGTVASTIIKNKARLVAQGYRHKMKMDVRVILYGNITEDVYDSNQPPVLKDPDITKQGEGAVSMVMDFEDLSKKKFTMSSWVNALSFCGLQVKQSNGGIFLSQDKYVKDILNKFDFRTIKPASTPIEAHKSLGKDEEGEDVDVHLYSFQVTHKGFSSTCCQKEFLAFSDSDYDGEQYDRRSLQEDVNILEKNDCFLDQCKKHRNKPIVVISSNEAEYVAAAVVVLSTACLRKYCLGKNKQPFRADLLFDDEMELLLPKQVIWDTLRDIGYEGNLAQLTFSKPLFSPQWKYLIHVLLHCLSPKSTSWEQFEVSNIDLCLVGLAKRSGSSLFFAKILYGIDSHSNSGSGGEEHSTSLHSRAAASSCKDALRQIQLKVHAHSQSTASFHCTAVPLDSDAGSRKLILRRKKSSECKEWRNRRKGFGDNYKATARQDQEVEISMVPYNLTSTANARQDFISPISSCDDYYEHIPPTGLGFMEDGKSLRWSVFHEIFRVHTLEFRRWHYVHMLAERRYPLSRELMIRMLDHGMEVEDENETAITLIHLFILWTTEDGDNS